MKQLTTMNSHFEMVKEEADVSCDENSESINIKIEIGDTWLHQPIWSSSQMSSEPTSDLLEQVEGMDELLRPNILSCHVCKQGFVNRYNLLIHNAHHLTVRIWKVPMYQCDDCLSYFTKKNLLERHQVQTHLFLGDKLKTTKMMHICEICSKMYSYKSWHHHMATVHSKKMEKCTLCNKIFKSSHYLQKHIKYVHKGLKPHWRFRTTPKSVNLKNVNCFSCNKSFTHPSSLKNHMKNVHPSEGSQECDVCGSVLKSAMYLRAHKQRVHYDDGRKHYCTICGKDYKSPRYVRVHMRNAHKLYTDKKKTDKVNYDVKNNIRKTSLDRSNSSDESTRVMANTAENNSQEVVLDKGKRTRVVGLEKENIGSNISNEYLEEREELHQGNVKNERADDEFVGVIYGRSEFRCDINKNLHVKVNCYATDYVKKEFEEQFIDGAPIDNIKGIKICKEETIAKTEQEEQLLFNGILDNCLQFKNT